MDSLSIIEEFMDFSENLELECCYIGLCYHVMIGNAMLLEIFLFEPLLCFGLENISDKGKNIYTFGVSNMGM